MAGVRCVRGIPPTRPCQDTRTDRPLLHGGPGWAPPVIEQWGLPIMSAAAVLAWSFVLWLTRRHPQAELVLVIVSAALALFVSSLASPGIVDTTMARFALGIERVVLLLAGIFALVWAVRYWHRGGT